MDQQALAFIKEEMVLYIDCLSVAVEGWGSLVETEEKHRRTTSSIASLDDGDEGKGGYGNCDGRMLRDSTLFIGGTDGYVRGSALFRTRDCWKVASKCALRAGRRADSKKTALGVS